MKDVVRLTLAAALLTLSTGCRLTSEESVRYEPSRQIVGAIPRAAAIEALREELGSPVQEQFEFEFVVTDEALTATWRIGGFSSNAAKDRSDVPWAEISYDAVETTLLGLSFRVLRLYGSNERRAFLQWDNASESSVSQEERVERLETCMEALESISVRRRPTTSE